MMLLGIGERFITVNQLLLSFILFFPVLNAFIWSEQICVLTQVVVSAVDCARCGPEISGPILCRDQCLLGHGVSVVTWLAVLGKGRYVHLCHYRGVVHIYLRCVH